MPKKKVESPHKTVTVYGAKAKDGEKQILVVGKAYTIDPALADQLLKLGRAAKNKPAK